MFVDVGNQTSASLYIYIYIYILIFHLAWESTAMIMSAAAVSNRTSRSPSISNSSFPPPRPEHSLRDTVKILLSLVQLSGAAC